MSKPRFMLASPIPKGFNLEGDWVAEEKYDGHRLLIESNPNRKSIKATSRNGIERLLPLHVHEAILRVLPAGVWDGELISTTKQKSYGVTELAEAASLCFVVFDVITCAGAEMTDAEYKHRRTLLETFFKRRGVLPDFHSEVLGCRLSASTPVKTNDDVVKLAHTVWDRGGEGLILKETSSPYEFKRSKRWLKVKQLHSAVLTVRGFIAGRLGPHAVVLLEDETGIQTTVKTKNDKLRAQAAQDPESFIGRKLRIEFQERTPDGSYRHPRWDRWEEE